MKRPIALIIIAAVFAAGFLSVRGAMPFMAIFGSSMEPELNPGDLITTEEVSAPDVEVGDVIVFNVPPIVRETYNYPLVVAHRVVRAYTTESGTTFRTQGDNVGGEDPFAVRDEDLRGKVGKKIPYLGFPLLFLQSQLGLIFAVASLCTFAYYLYAAEFGRGGRRVYRGLFAPVIQENHRSNRLTERALGKFSSAIETYAEHLNSHTSAIQSLSEASQGLKNSTADQNKVLTRMMETMEQAPVRQERIVPEVEQPQLAEESGEEPLPPALISAEELGEDFLPPAPVSAEESGEDFLPPAPVSTEESGEDFLPPAPVSAEELGEDFLPPAPVSTEESGEDFLPPAPVSAEESGEDFLPPAPVSAEESGEDFLPSAPVSAEESGEDFLPPAPVSAEELGEDFLPPAPVSAEESGEDFLPPAPVSTEESGEDFLPPAPVSVEESGEDFLPPAPVSAEESGEDFLPPAPVSAEESGEDFLPSAFVSDVITVLELIGQVSLFEEDVQNIIESQRKQDALDDCLAAGLLERVSDHALVLTSKGKQFLVNGTPPKEILKEFLLSKPNIVSCLEKIGDSPKLRPRVLQETLAYSNPGWTEATWERRSKVLTNWLIYTQLVTPIRSRVTSYPARLF